MSRAILLDAGPIGLATNPNRSPMSLACARWLQSHVSFGTRIILPEIADYEVRRELLRARKTRGLERLDALGRILEYQPLTTDAMRQAAEFWARARQRGEPTADDKNIDADMILAAQAVTLNAEGVIIATTNVGHLARLAPADLWQGIPVK